MARAFSPYYHNTPDYHHRNIFYYLRNTYSLCSLPTLLSALCLLLHYNEERINRQCSAQPPPLQLKHSS